MQMAKTAKVVTSRSSSFSAFLAINHSAACVPQPHAKRFETLSFVCTILQRDPGTKVGAILVSLRSLQANNACCMSDEVYWVR